MIYASVMLSGCTVIAQALGGIPAQSNGQLVLWAVVLIAVAAALFLAEIFVPSGGLLGAASALSLIGGVVMLFRIDTTLGLIGAIVSVLAIPCALLGALKIWPNTPVGRALTLGVNDDEHDPNHDGQAPPPTPTHVPRITVGTRGKALTELRPVGTCLFDGQRHECLSQSGLIEAGARVSVVSADGMQIKVRPIDRV